MRDGGFNSVGDLDQILVFGFIKQHKNIFIDSSTNPGSTFDAAIPSDIGATTGHGKTHRSLGDNGGPIAFGIVWFALESAFSGHSVIYHD